MQDGRSDRRTFLKTASVSAGGLSLGLAVSRASARAQGANERIRVAMMGLGGRGQFLVNRLLERDDSEIAYVCDVDSRRIGSVAAKVEEQQGIRPQMVTDFRQILDDANVDALFNATPDHWHALPTIMACQAGKDVYVEKPASHNIWEGRKMVEAARKYQRIVQLGTQTRSADYAFAAVEYIRSGQLGDVHYVRVLNMKERSTIGHKEDEPVPEGVDYDMWLGPAPARPFNPNRFHYAWHWFWDYSGGDIINDGVHQLDLARWLIGKDYPLSVVCTGGKYHFDDDQECPDTQCVHYEYDRLTMVTELALWTPYMKKEEWAHRDLPDFPNWTFDATRVEVFGTKGLMYIGRHGGGYQVFDADWKVIAEGPGRHPHDPHINNFFECMRTRKRPNADIEEGHKSTILCHLGNISYRVGGRRLYFDAATETFLNDEEANRLVKRQGRKPWVIPEEV
ncbi:MAG: Gfo/Idh/MocA family protein [Candidatus Zipacnadales bacterium]